MITRREILKLPALAAQPAPRRRPNIIFLLADDLGCFDLGCYGQKLIQTPNIDRVAKEGMLFTQAYAGATVCAPSRCALMTGRHAGHGTIRHNHSLRAKGARVPLLAEDTTVAEVLKSAGYQTAIFGKWGLGEPDTTGIPNRQGFDEWFGYLNQDHAEEYYTDHLWRNQRLETIEANRNGAKGAYTHDLFTAEGLRFIRQQRANPFFLYLPWTVPHAEHIVPSDEPYTNRDWKPVQKTYAAMVSRLDRDVGRILALLKELNLDNDTILFFSSDNGATLSDAISLFHSTGSLRGKKGQVYEGGIRAPLLARWPGRIAPGSRCDEPTAFWDFLPTAAELAGTPPPAGLDGVSYAPILLGRNRPATTRALYWESYNKHVQQALRIGNWKAVRHGISAPLELYDLKSDEAESRDVAAANPDVVAKLKSRLDAERSESAEYPVKA